MTPTTATRLAALAVPFALTAAATTATAQNDGPFAAVVGAIDLPSAGVDIEQGFVNANAASIGPRGEGSPSTALGDYFASADLGAGELKARGRLQTNKASGAHNVLATAAFGDTFRHLDSAGSPFVFDGGDTATFRLDISGSFMSAGAADFGPSADVFVRILTLNAGTLDNNEVVRDTGRLPIGASSALSQNLINDFSVDLSGESRILDITDFSNVTPTFTTTNFPDVIDVEVPVAGDFDFVVQMFVNLNAFNPDGVDITADFSNTIGVEYLPTVGVETVQSGSGVFPGTVPVPAPGAASLLLGGLALSARRRRA